LTFVGGPGAVLFLPNSFNQRVDFSDFGLLIINLLGEIAVPVEETPYVIGTGGRSSVPEPPTAILLGIGLACLGLACTRARRRQSAPV
jgi:hypothetical protein